MRFPFFALMLAALWSIPTLAAQISFFEEFPNATTFEKVALADFDTKIYLAARNLSEFEMYETWLKAANPHVKDVVYWPVLEKDEGYWISPWADATGLERILGEIEQRKDRKPLSVMLDLELPLKRSMLFSFKNFKQNKQRVEDFISRAAGNGVSVYTVEKSYIPDSILEPLGLSYDSEKFGNKKIKMFYSSYWRRHLPDSVVDRILEGKMKKYAENSVIIGLGKIALGVNPKRKRINTPEILEQELKTANKYGVEETILFRLEGLNESYLKTIHESLA